MAYETVIGLEVHVVLNTREKLFCCCGAKKGAAPNTQVCPVCLGKPGALPRLNQEALKKAVAAAAALCCRIQSPCHFDRKHYEAPDLPKGYQITQDETPLGVCGRLNQVRIRRVHLEEDAGKMVYGNESAMADYNRAGLPLIEIVTEPDLRTANETADFLRLLHQTLVATGVTTGLLHEGAFRCDVNVSLHEEGAPLGTRVEIKNLNSFKFVKRAVEAEEARQRALMEAGLAVLQQTRRFDEKQKETVFMREKETHGDYRYEREPALGNVFIAEKDIHALQDGT